MQVSSGYTMNVGEYHKLYYSISHNNSNLPLILDTLQVAGTRENPISLKQKCVYHSIIEMLTASAAFTMPRMSRSYVGLVTTLKVTSVKACGQTPSAVVFQINRIYPGSMAFRH